MSQSNMPRRSRRLNKNGDNEPVPQYFFAAFTGDRSGSMSSLDSASAEGLYEWVKTMKETSTKNNQEGFISVTTFDDETNKIFDNYLQEPYLLLEPSEVSCSVQHLREE